MNKLYAALLAAITTALLVVPALAATPSKADLAKVRKATERFRDVKAAERAGYISTKECVAKKGSGAMGIHYLNGALIADGRVDIAKPEILLYEPKPGGGMTLVGVEYFVMDADQRMDTVDALGKPLGQSFDGPMVHNTPVHYDLHVWLYRKNPKGMFSQYNPKVRC